MKFEEFEAAFIKLNRKLWIALLIMLVLMSLGFWLTWIKRTYVVYQGGEIFKENLLMVDVCKEGFLSVVKGEVNPLLVTDEIMRMVKKEPFLLEVTDILFLRSIDETRCKLIIKTPKLRAFTINLVANISYPFQYKLDGVTEHEPKEIKE